MGLGIVLRSGFGFGLSNRVKVGFWIGICIVLYGYTIYQCADGDGVSRH